MNNNKGNWEYSFFQKFHIENEEQNIKTEIRPEHVFDIKKIKDYINPQLSKEQVIEQMVLNNEKISKTQNIIYENYIKTKENNIKLDIDNIKKNGLKTIPKTYEGKIHYLLHGLDLELKKKNYENIANIFLKLKGYNISDEINKIYSKRIEQMNTIVSKLDLIELQFTKFYSQMPPLNNKGFHKFDDWQIKVINNIDNNISTLLSIPTSGGKSIISGYVTCKGRTLFIVPTDALAWQVASYIGYLSNTDVPIITLTYQSIPRRDEFITRLNSASSIVGTSELILDYLPFINNNFSWVVFDEIHMIGSTIGAGMESIAKVLSHIPFLALSATIGNPEELKSWFESLNNTTIDYISCTKRFFNLQKYYFDSINKMKQLNPLSLVDEEDFKNGNILNKKLDPTPLDTWDLVLNLLDKNLGNLHPHIYFDKYEVIELNKANEYFNELIKFMVNNYDNVKDIINKYTGTTIPIINSNLLKLISELKENNMTPAIIFQQNTISCLKVTRQLAIDIELEESRKYPSLRSDRIKNEKKNKAINKKIDKETKELTEKQEVKMMLDPKCDKLELKQIELINAPHPEFIFTNEKFTQDQIIRWDEKFKLYFPNINGDYHFLIKLLWRGIGVYVNGLPDNYLRLVQSLASKKKLAFVLSDQSLVFGVSMPFRTSVIYTCPELNDNLDSMLYHQMAGRAGRRGLDKEGNVVFIGYSWDRIKDLSTCNIPIINGLNRPIYTSLHAKLISNNEKWQSIICNNLSKNNLVDLITEDKWQLNNDINNLQLMWNLRYSKDSLVVNFLIEYLHKYFNNLNPSCENDQIEIAFFFSKFIHIYEINENNKYILPEKSILKINYNTLYEKINNLGINYPSNIDGRIWYSIKKNSLLELDNEELRQRLFDFNIKIKSIQHYCFHSKYVTLSKLLGKLLTRIWWIYHSSSPLN
jgi:superfamily II DNA or RNA helicase